MPVTIGGCVINPGDIVVGDSDGIVSFPQHCAESLLEAVRQQETREADTMKLVREGRYDGRYGKTA